MTKGVKKQTFTTQIKLTFTSVNNIKNILKNTLKKKKNYNDTEKARNIYLVQYLITCFEGC